MSDMQDSKEDKGILTTKLSPTEVFPGANGTNLEGVTIVDYWQWAYSGILGNTERGNLAEFLVAKALDIDTDVRNDWEDFDLITKDDVKIEVKSSAYIQSWAQKQFYSPRFSIKKTLPTWDYKSTTKARRADIYVFCLLAHKDKQTINPMDVTQWEFYALRTVVIERDLGDAQSISLVNLRKISQRYSFGELGQGVQDLLW